MIRILVVCMGNICRSPLAELALGKCLQEQGLEAEIEVQSAGTHGSHVGEGPDARALGVATERGYVVGGKRARKVVVDDFERFDWILAMDESNLRYLERLCPENCRQKLALFLDFAGIGGEVADPYYGNLAGFENTLATCERAAAGIVERLLALGALDHRDTASM